MSASELNGEFTRHLLNDCVERRVNSIIQRKSLDLWILRSSICTRGSMGYSTISRGNSVLLYTVRIEADSSFVTHEDI